MSQWHDNKQATEATTIQGSIEANAQKTTNKYFDQALKQTTAFIESLPSGRYTFLYPTVLEEVAKNSNQKLRILSYDTVSKKAVVEKL